MALSDDFAACFGFSTSETLSKNFANSATLRSIISDCTNGKHSECVADSEDWLKDFVFGLFNTLDSNQERLA